MSQRVALIVNLRFRKITSAIEGARIPMWTHEGDDILYVNKDRSKVVPEDSPEAAFVLREELLRGCTMFRRCGVRKFRARVCS